MGAVISDCEKYRYTLSRDVGENPLVFCMLNPSTADAEKDDRTIAKCRKYAKRFGYDGIIVVNLYAYRATNPKDMLAANDPIGPDNTKYLSDTVKGRDVICAWGGNACPNRALEAIKLMSSNGANLYCLSVTSKGQPGHPLYLKGDLPMMPLPEMLTDTKPQS